MCSSRSSPSSAAPTSPARDWALPSRMRSSTTTAGRSTPKAKGLAAAADLSCDCRLPRRTKECRLPTTTDSIPTPTRTLKVLIVEDEPRLRDLLLDVIPDMGFTATAARSAEEATKIMQAEAHDVLLLDLQL